MQRTSSYREDPPASLFVIVLVFIAAIALMIWHASVTASAMTSKTGKRWTAMDILILGDKVRIVEDGRP